MTSPGGGPSLVSAGPTPEVIEQLGDPETFLTEAEQDRARRLRSAADRSDFVAAHGLVRLVAARLLGGSPGDLTVVQRCSGCGGAHGQPRITEAPEVQVSWSHTQGFVAAIAGFGPVAVDADHPPESLVDALVDLVLSPDEREALASARDPALMFARHWVRKESFVKLGLATLDDLSSIGLGGLPAEQSWPAGPGWRQLAWRDWHLVEWWHPQTQTVGTAIAATPPTMAPGGPPEWGQLPA